MKLPDEVWEVIKAHIAEYRGYAPDEGLRQVIENNTEIELFDGGAFVSLGNEFDVFVTPNRRGRWQIRRIGTEYLEKMGKKYGRITAKINARNTASLRLARFFGFRPFAKNGDLIHMEKIHG